ncbi:MAG: sulfotransferase, partial [Rhodobacteraceae bacterium]|nr:sulfotransferase [Paracoccaceae bacterium]
MPGLTVAAALGQNPAAYGLPECNLELEPMTDAVVREMTGLRSAQIHGLLRVLAQLLSGEQVMGSVEMARRWLMQRLHLPTSYILREIAELTAPRRLVIPTTAGLLYPSACDRLVGNFDNALFVHLQMHPYNHATAVMSQHQGAAARITGAIDKSGDDDVVDPQMLWAEAEEGVARIATAVGPDRFFSLRCEDLADDSAKALAGLAKQLGLPANKAAVAAMAAPENSVFAGIGPYGANMGGDIRTLAALRAELSAPKDALDGTLPWNPNGKGFGVDLQQRAR